MFDFKTLTLQLYNQEVTITFIPGTECYARYGRSMTGVLVGRLWGERFDQGKPVSTVIGVTIKMDYKEYNISCHEIQNIERAVFRA